MRGIALAPERLDFIQLAVMAYLGEGDLPGARHVLRDVPPTLDRDALVAFMAQYWALYWVLDDDDSERALRLTPASFDNDRGNWALIRAQIYQLRGDRKRVATYATSARRAFAGHLRRNPDDWQIRILLGLGLAYLGESEAASREAERGLAAVLAVGDRFWVPYARHVVARVRTALGESGKALDQLEAMLREPYCVSPAWLRIDPSFVPLRGHPRFERLSTPSPKSAGT
jgi:AcrR family transcriptional regulator